MMQQDYTYAIVFVILDDEYVILSTDHHKPSLFNSLEAARNVFSEIQLICTAGDRESQQKIHAFLTLTNPVILRVPADENLQRFLPKKKPMGADFTLNRQAYGTLAAKANILTFLYYNIRQWIQLDIDTSVPPTQVLTHLPPGTN
ncbi:hypothetical protein GA0116948_11073 [Chitinophaga costaii]|uniref:Uncharacterized protein n=1 Tax=Chitinophaga costaii TaxID=1335309 RepID=A0A1C4EX35_9BACT|nr:hypothetical protein [Chitinophaga costaii]PUZ21588.1 hypothetical protein DCM91_16265 [Chitinophaga costaii]SCC48071.1 hypothetical protein GA0116948_11073 [Chitinophaga costaii]